MLTRKSSEPVLESLILNASRPARGSPQTVLGLQALEIAPHRHCGDSKQIAEFLDCYIATRFDQGNNTI